MFKKWILATVVLAVLVLSFVSVSPQKQANIVPPQPTAPVLEEFSQ